jgi:hypothetical protein
MSGTEEENSSENTEQQCDAGFIFCEGGFMRMTTCSALVLQWEKTLEEARTAIRLNSATVEPYTNPAVAFMSLNRPDEARKVLEDALSQKRDGPPFVIDSPDKQQRGRAATSPLREKKANPNRGRSIA